ncbi:hypothetical protein EMCRGX_G020250 [Ephydatia muelleri]
MTNKDDLDDVLANIDVGQLNITHDDADILDEAAGHIQENLEDELVQAALRKGYDLRQYSREIESELRRAETHSIQDYIAQSRYIASLHYQICSCDQILAGMEDMLSKFQTDLGSISSEIQSMQDQSHSMNIQLRNRKVVREMLSKYVGDITVTEHLIQHINETPASEREFTENLRELNDKLEFVKQQREKGYASVNDVYDVVEKLKLKAIAKTREFLLQKIYQFRKPMANYQMLQHQLQNYKYFNQFLMSHSRDVAEQIRSEYVDTMMKIYFSYFKDYCTKLFKLEYEEVVDKDDLMGAEDSAKKDILLSAPKSRATVFTLGSRDVVLTTEIEDPIIVVPHAQKAERRYSHETLFRSVHYALMENASREYVFLMEFFNLTPSNAQDFFDAVFGKTLALLLQNSELYVQGCYDAIGIFLCVHINHYYQDVMVKKRGVPCLTGYSHDLQAILWPRLKYILELNIDSVKRTDPRRLGHIDTRPHYITRRYAEFSAAFVKINQHHPDEQVDQCLSSLQVEVENLVLKIAAEFPDRKEQLIFLINNYDMMLGVLAERTSEESKETETFKQLLRARTDEFIEEVLSPHFGGIIRFVKEVEPLMEQGSRESVAVDEKRIQQLVRSFAADWKKSIETLNRETMQSFTNFKNGTQILQAVLTQMFQYYQRFQNILSQPPFKPLPIRGELVNVHHLMVEIKKQKALF